MVVHLKTILLTTTIATKITISTTACTIVDRSKFLQPSALVVPYQRQGHLGQASSIDCYLRQRGNERADRMINFDPSQIIVSYNRRSALVFSTGVKMNQLTGMESSPFRLLLLFSLGVTAIAFVVAVVLCEISGVVRQLLSVSSESIARKPGTIMGSDILVSVEKKWP